MNVCYSGFFGSYSGMGSACRAYIQSLIDAGVNVKTEYIKNISSPYDLGVTYKNALERAGRGIDYKIKIIHTTPDLITKHLEPNKYHIFHLFWETDSLPDWWVWALNLVDEVWTGSEWNKQAFIKSGVKKPIYVFPQPVTVEYKDPFTIKDFDGYLFYSIFQWIERKDPKSLLTAYWREFQDDENVGLLLKTYKEGFTENETMSVVKEIATWKKELGQKKYPKVFLCPYGLSSDEMMRLHTTGDCFVSSHRGEGWGRNIAEAMALKKPVIATNLGGIHEYLPIDTYFPVGYKMVNVFNMGFVPWYSEKQVWGQVDEDALRKNMRHVYENKELAKMTAKKGQEFVVKNMNSEEIGKLLRKRLEEIENG